jgi:trigger factor
LSDDCKRTLEITVPLEEIESVRGRVVAGFAAKATLPGFRPGKAPLSVIQSRFAEEIKQEVLDQLLQKSFYDRVQELDLDVVSSPSVTDLHFHDGEPLRYTAEFEVRPGFELQTYEGLEVPYAEPTVTDEEVDARIEAMRQRRAELVNVDPRPVEDGDFAVISLRSLTDVGTEEPISQDEMNLEVGGEYTLPEFTENVRGMQPGETREFDVVYPEDYSGTNLAGRTVRFEVTVKGIRKKELPELNDEFAKDMGDYKGLDDLREAVRGSMLAERQFYAREQAKSEIGRILGESYSFPVPEVFVRQQVESRVRRQLLQLAEQGADMKNLKLDWEKVLEQEREPATKVVRAGLVLDRIATAESIDVTQREVDEEIEREARRERTTPAAIREQLEKNGGLGRLASQIRTEKTLDFLFEKSIKVDPPPPPPAAEETPASAE